MSRFPCNQALIDSLGLYLDGGVFWGEPQVVCQPTPSSCIGSGWIAVNRSTFCTDFSSAVQISSGALISKRTLNRNANILVGFASYAWATEIRTGTGLAASDWSVMTRIDLTQKYPINSSPGIFLHKKSFLTIVSLFPVTGSLPIIRVIEGQTAVIQIPAADWDTDDDIRCRWASSTGVAGDECGDICNNLPNATLSPRSVILNIVLTASFQELQNYIVVFVQ